MGLINKFLRLNKDKSFLKTLNMNMSIYVIVDFER